MVGSGHPTEAVASAHARARFAWRPGSALPQSQQLRLKRTVVMGRNMAGRVRPYAEKNGYDVYGGSPGWIPRGLQRLAPKTLDEVDSVVR
jgi:hypothetical protein